MATREVVHFRTAVQLGPPEFPAPVPSLNPHRSARHLSGVACAVGLTLVWL
jgi:hypothetical protein